MRNAPKAIDPSPRLSVGLDPYLTSGEARRELGPWGAVHYLAKLETPVAKPRKVDLAAARARISSGAAGLVRDFRAFDRDVSRLGMLFLTKVISGLIGCLLAAANWLLKTNGKRR
jgi:hypothetical protein